MKSIDSFETKLDLPELEDVEIKYEKPVFNEDKIDDADEDYKYLRDKLRFFMSSGEMVLSKAVNSVASDPSPRGIEAASLILRNVLKISETILNLHKETKNILKPNKVEENTKDKDNILSASLVDIISEINKIEKK